MVLAPPSRQCTRSKADTEYKGSVTFTAVKSATSAVPHANVLQFEINADNSVPPTLTFTQFELRKGDIEDLPVNETKAVFIRWDTFEDEFGSHINLTPKVEKIQGNYFDTYIITGTNSKKVTSYAGVTAYPDPSTLDAMKKMNKLSFMVFGDGGSYGVNLTTSETGEEAGFNHYRKDFTAKKGVISEIKINIDDLSQATTFGKQVPFIHDHIETFNLQVYSKGDFNLKFWDIRLY